MTKKTVAETWGIKMPPVQKSKLTPFKTSNDSLVCGVELEIENLPSGHGYYVDLAGSFWVVDEDGSLRPRGEAWEFISKPAPMSVMLAEVANLLTNLKVTEEDNYSDRCSVHIHTNVLDFTQGQIASLALIYPVFESVLFRFINHYKKKEDQGYCRDTNLYCIPWSDCRLNKNLVDNMFNSPDSIRYWQKYTALNLLPIREKGTVEWRHLHGTCDIDKITQWVNMIGAIMAYAKNTSFDDIVKTITILNDVSSYQQFFQDVLQGTLDYTEEYRPLLAEGVVNAKYSLMNWEANKNKPKKKSLLDSLAEYNKVAVDDVAPAHPQDREAPRRPVDTDFITWHWDAWAWAWIPHRRRDQQPQVAPAQAQGAQVAWDWLAD